MGDVMIYHPETGGSVAVPEMSLHHYRQSGWITAAEWNELQQQKAANEEQRLAQEAPKAAPPARPAMKSGKE